MFFCTFFWQVELSDDKIEQIYLSCLANEAVASAGATSSSGFTSLISSDSMCSSSSSSSPPALLQQILEKAQKVTASGILLHRVLHNDRGSKQPAVEVTEAEAARSHCQSSLPNTSGASESPTSLGLSNGCGAAARSEMPPISQEQMNQYSCLNTEEIVKQVKEVLGRFSISQRLFGESVLGLSQGSVSDLLARPKPWRMLTQKGREPFIRMQLFLEESGSVIKLLAGTYSKVALTKDTPASTIGGGSTENLSLPPPVSTVSEAVVQQIAKSDSADMDTAILSGRVTEVLARHSISEALFGELVIGGMSALQVSELLAHPVPWSQLSIKAREPYVRMQIWLSDYPTNVAKLQLQAIRNEGMVDLGVVSDNSDSAANRLKKSSLSCHPTVSKAVLSETKSKLLCFQKNLNHVEKYFLEKIALKRASGASLDETMAAVLTDSTTGGESFHDSSASQEVNVKKPRIVFTEYQKRCLLMSYSEESYPRPEVLEVCN